MFRFGGHVVGGGDEAQVVAVQKCHAGGGRPEHHDQVLGQIVQRCGGVEVGGHGARELAQPQEHLDVHDVDSENWHVRREGEDNPLQSFTTQDEAFEAGREVAKQHQVELIVQGADGKIIEKNSYGHDPRDVED